MLVQLLVLYTDSELVESHSAQHCRQTDDRMMPIVDHTVWQYNRLKISPKPLWYFLQTTLQFHNICFERQLEFGRLCNAGAEWCAETFDQEKISRAAVFITDCSCDKRCDKTPASVTLLLSSCERMRDNTSDWRMDLDTDRRIVRSWRSPAWQVDKVFTMWDLIQTSLSMYIPRSRTTEAGAIWSEPTRSGKCGRWWRWRLVVDQRNSVFAVFICNWLERIHAATSSMHADIGINSSWDADGRQEPRICVSSAKRCGLKPWLSISDNRSTVYSKKRIGPITDPCRAGVENEELVRTCWRVASEPLKYHTAELICMF